MGFGSYDESEQQDLDADFDDEDAVQSEENAHRGSIEFENGASSDELIDRLKEIKDGPGQDQDREQPPEN
ncbi:DUF5786 family protein [Halobacteria archaeon AArc-m2/3/4]|uniref:DUF5786 family protein n=1 Tax=Natronoglomus mannanivorans TaxID=2979990 RepID=A0ABT2QFG5_9EURY|nr:DUF5786 family protein [Halobacteria archaeon AArc-m2/3/4]